MKLIGLCGRSGSGKGTFAICAEQEGIKVIDCDSVYRDLVSKPSDCLTELAESFGDSIVVDNSLDRASLAKIVFTDKEKLELLNKITHKHIRAEIAAIVSGFDDDEVVILDAPTLFESGIDGICDHIVGIVADDELCVSRITERDGINEENARLRLLNQLTNDFIIENSDSVVYNDSTREAFENASHELARYLKEEYA